jgi:hypothetical protein
MNNYDSLRTKHGKKVPQTVDTPILVFDYFELIDVFIAFGIVLIFGVILYSWWLMLFLLILFLGFGPVIKKNNEKGIFFHWPYKNLHMSLPGLVNPRGTKKYTDIFIM